MSMFRAARLLSQPRRVAPAAFSRSIPRVMLSRSNFVSTRTLTTKRFTKDHEWIEYDNETQIGTISITDYAQNSLGDVVFVELPAVGAEFTQGDNIGAVESVKAASDIYAPVSGKVLEINEELNSQPGLLNKSPEKDGWLCKLQLSKPEEVESLLSSEDYQALIN